MLFSREWLFQNYVIDGLNYLAIARLKEVRPADVLNALIEHNIILRSSVKLDDELILSSYQFGLKVSDIAKQFGATEGSIYRILKNNNINPPIHKIDLDQKQIDFIIETYRLNSSITRIAEHMGIPDDWVRSILKKNKIVRTASESLIKYRELHDRQALTQMIDSEMTRRDICDFVGCSESALKSALSKFNLSIKTNLKLRSTPSMINQNILENPDKLRQYVQQYPTLSGLSKILKRKSSTIKKHLIKQNLDHLLQGYKTQQKQLPKISEEVLIDLYVKQHQSARQIAKSIDCYTSDITTALRTYNIQVRTGKDYSSIITKIKEKIDNGLSINKAINEEQISLKTFKKLCKKYNININEIKQTDYNLKNRDWLFTQLETKDPYKIAQELGVKTGVVERYIQHFKIRNTIFSRHEANSDAHKSRISSSMVDAILAGDVKVRSSNISHDSPIVGKLILSSSLEKFYAKNFDELGFPYEYETIVIPYDNHHYIVDFKIIKPNRIELKEVKHSAFLSHLLDDRLALKILALNDYCLDNDYDGFVLTEIGEFDVRLLNASLRNIDLMSLLPPNEIVKYFLTRGFLCPYVGDQIITDQLSDIFNTDYNLEHADILKMKCDIHKRFYDHFWSSNKKGSISIRKAFTDLSLLKKASDRIVNDQNPFTESRFIRELCRVGASIPSTFRPQLARSIYKLYNPTSVLDPCMGWGGRLLGSIGLCKYYGRDINKKMLIGGRKLLDWLKTNNYQFDIELAYSDLLSYVECPQKVDMIFTSPPFGNTEDYDGCSTLEINPNIYINALFNLSSNLNENGVIAIHYVTPIEAPKNFVRIGLHSFLTPGAYQSKRKSEYISVFKIDLL